jgi:hypothetical protein
MQTLDDVQQLADDFYSRLYDSQNKSFDYGDKHTAKVADLLDEYFDDSDEIHDAAIDMETAPTAIKAMFNAYRLGDFKSMTVHARAFCNDIESYLEEKAEIKCLKV